jgi:TolB-like protein/Tfp pilus assembly protein PilF
VIIVTDVNAWSELERSEIERHLERLLTSRIFAPSRHLQDILRYLVEEALAGRARQINQTSIAIDVLGRDAHFDPSVDSLVRVEAGRLRAKLREYYYEEGKGDTLRFELPKGHYIPRISTTQPPDARHDEGTDLLVEDVDAAESSHLFRHRTLPVLVIGLFTVVLLIVVFSQNLSDDDEVESSESPVQSPVDKATTPIAIPRGKSVAVLPFDNHSAAEEEAAFFADGLHDDLLTQLTKIEDLKVISRTSVMRYRGTTTPIPQIAEELHVSTVLVGAVQRAGDRIRIHIQFIDAQTDEHLWAESFDRELNTANIFEIQRDIAMKTAATLQSTITEEEQQRLAIVPTDNLEAYEDYLLGRQHMVNRTSDGLAKAIDYFQQAIALDPNFAMAYVGLSDTYQLQFWYSGLPEEEMLPKAEAAINKALALDDKSGEAYASLGLLKGGREHLDGAEVAYQKALALNPNYAMSYHWYGNLLHDTGRSKEASALFQKALVLDPHSMIINYMVAYYHAMFGRFDEAMAQMEKVIEIDPASTHGYGGKARLYWWVYGRLDEAVPWIRKAISLDLKNPNGSAFLGYLYLELGDDKQAECWINRAIKLGPENYWPNFSMSYLHAYRNELDQALPYARQALKVAPTYWGALTLLRNHDLRVGNYEKARSHYEKTFPSLLMEDEPTFNLVNYVPAIDLAYVLQLIGEQERADLLLDRSLALIRSGLHRIGFDGYGTADVQIYALRGEKQLALTTLRQAIDEGWRLYWRYYLEHDPNLESIRNEPEFQSMLAEIKADMAEQLARVKEMEKEGDVCVNP